MIEYLRFFVSISKEMPECPICYECHVPRNMVACDQCRKSICLECENRITTNKCPLCRFEKPCYSAEDYYPICDEYHPDTYKTYASDYPDENDLDFYLL